MAGWRSRAACSTLISNWCISTISDMALHRGAGGAEGTREQSYARQRAAVLGSENTRQRRVAAPAAAAPDPCGVKHFDCRHGACPQPFLLGQRGGKEGGTNVSAGCGCIPGGCGGAAEEQLDTPQEGYRLWTGGTPASLLCAKRAGDPL